LKVISKSIRDAARLFVLKPLRVKNDIKDHTVRKGGNLAATSQRYKTRLMRTAQNQVSGHAFLTSALFDWILVYFVDTGNKNS